MVMVVKMRNYKLRLIISLTKRLLLIFILISVKSEVLAENKLITNNDEIFKTFMLYREKSLENSSETVSFFSKKVNEIWLNWLLEEQGDKEVLRIRHSIINRLNFGSRINYINDHNIHQDKHGGKILTIHYKYNSEDKSYMTYEIGYI